MSHVTHKLDSPLQGALAGGGDPATSPLYVFGPFLRLIVVAGVAQITFGVSVWLAVLTVVMVSAMYRKVMIWVTDGSGGSGLAEEEFGGWAVKINAAITFIEYTLTFLVSMAALVTFIADRFPMLNESIFGFQYRVFLAIALSAATGWVVNLGPKVAARAFGPATAAILLLLWLMIAASVWRFGLVLPSIDWRALSPQYLNFTLGGYARILALMTGIEIFANLVVAYSGTREQKSRKAFGSLLIIMGTTCLTMLIVGPAILTLSDPTDPHVSVFTQTMDKLLPSWASYAGTLTGVAVLLSACAASAQGLQNLSLGLRYRHYVPASYGEQNYHGVAARPVWVEIAIVVICFFLFGTQEETYLALYAAGVFVLLSMTGWAATKRLVREGRVRFSLGTAFTVAGTLLAALLTSAATVIIFGERFLEGAWLYLIMVPALYAFFGFHRKRLGAPTPVEDRLGLVVAEQKCLPDFGRDSSSARLGKIFVPLNGSILAEQSLPTARYLSDTFGADLTLVGVKVDKTADAESGPFDCDEYLLRIVDLVGTGPGSAGCESGRGDPADEIDRIARDRGADLIVISTRGGFDIERVFTNSVSVRLLKQTALPVMILRPTDDWSSRYTECRKIIVALDGSAEAENVLPFVRTLADGIDNEILLVSVPEGAESENYGETARLYLEGIAEQLNSEKTATNVLFGGSGPARTILAFAESEHADLIVMATTGRGGIDRDDRLSLGSVPTRVMEGTKCPVLLIPTR
jgi:nucleotide-binding universal stress UspA family protein